ncbi:hypothetical protein NHQ30_000850 [Ciborinia camelliae]|nr:hypothetical protein NHQ30_000850 [Ciborinia camelliae]
MSPCTGRPYDSEMMNLAKENERLRKELKEAKQLVAALAHKEYQVPDGSIKEDYQKLCQAIEKWVDYASSKELGDFKNRFGEALNIEAETHMLREIGIQCRLPAALDPRMHWLGRLDMLHYFILSLTIVKHIFCEIFTKQYPIGVTESQRATFLRIEKEMSRMGKEKSKISQWRLETLTAICASRSYKDEQKRQLSRIQNDLEKELSFWYKNSSSPGSKAQLQTDIIDPAVKLHQDMQCSTKKYDFSDRRDAQSKPSSGNEQYLPDIVKEITTWKTMTSDGTDVFFQVLYPGIEMFDLETEKKSELVGPIMTVYKRGLGIEMYDLKTEEEKPELVEPIMAVYETGDPPQAGPSATSSSAKSPSRAKGSIKETRDSKHRKTGNSEPKGINYFILNLITKQGSREKSGNDRNFSERTTPRGRSYSESSSSRTSRRASHDTSSNQTQNPPSKSRHSTTRISSLRPSRHTSRATNLNQVQYPSQSYDRTMGNTQLSPSTQNGPGDASPSTYTHTFTAGPHSDEITVEMAKPEKGVYISILDPTKYPHD